MADCSQICIATDKATTYIYIKNNVDGNDMLYAVRDAILAWQSESGTSPARLAHLIYKYMILEAIGGMIVYETVMPGTAIHPLVTIDCSTSKITYSEDGCIPQDVTFTDFTAVSKPVYPTLSLDLG